MISDGLADASIEAFDHTVCLRVKGFGQFVFDAVSGADFVEGVASGSGLSDFPGFGEAVGELAAIVGEDGMDRFTKGREEVVKGLRDGLCAAVVEDIDMDEAGCAFDGDEDIGGFALESWQMFEVDMDIAKGCGLEGFWGVCVGVGFARCGDRAPPPESI